VKAIRNLNGHSIGPYQIHAGRGRRTAAAAAAAFRLCSGDGVF
jgi:hypothetical protein